jgi:DNA-binding MarR family transcriptional regulator
MSSAPVQIPPTALALSKNAPFIGALLRLTYQVSRRRSLSALMERGFTDVNQSLLNALFYPMAQGGMRPIDMAEQTNMTKQAMNYLIGQLEAAGYLERRRGERGDRRLIYMTRRGWLVFETIWKAQIQLQKDWEKMLGKKRFDEFMKTLRQLSGVEKNERRKETSARQR